MNVIELVHNNIENEISSTFKLFINLIDEYSDCSNTVLPCDTLSGSVYKKLKSKNQRELTILLQTGGISVTKISGKTLWPVQATIMEIPLPVRDHISVVMIFSAWLGSTHTNRELLWNNVVEQLQNLSKNGLIIKLDNNKKIKFNIRVQMVTFDLPALAYNCNITQFNDYNACPFCKIMGMLLEDKFLFFFFNTCTTKN